MREQVKVRRTWPKGCTGVWSTDPEFRMGLVVDDVERVERDPRMVSAELGSGMAVATLLLEPWVLRDEAKEMPKPTSVATTAAADTKTKTLVIPSLTRAFTFSSGAGGGGGRTIR